ncbi:MAG: hypothetical protein LBV54_04480 [Puniceicoccales bacterium]|nr:hypothetical protein [Puniceicoccales bacterium]
MASSSPMSLFDKLCGRSAEKIAGKEAASLLKTFSGKGGKTAVFDGALDAMEIGVALAAPEKTYFTPLVLVETDNELRLVAETSFAAPLRFLSWFRWIWLAGTGGMAFAGYQSAFDGKTAWAVQVFGMVFICASLGMGLLGAFVIFPLLRRLFLRIDRLGEKTSADFPALDLQGQRLILPAKRGAVPWAELRGFDLGPATSDSWFPLQAHTTDGQILFLANYPKSKRQQAAKHAQALAARAGVRCLVGE